MIEQIDRKQWKDSIYHNGNTYYLKKSYTQYNRAKQSAKDLEDYYRYVVIASIESEDFDGYAVYVAGRKKETYLYELKYNK